MINHNENGEAPTAVCHDSGLQELSVLHFEVMRATFDSTSQSQTHAFALK